jgi:hypothetical protein
MVANPDIANFGIYFQLDGDSTTTAEMRFLTSKGIFSGQLGVQQSLLVRHF